MKKMKWITASVLILNWQKTSEVYCYKWHIPLFQYFIMELTLLLLHEDCDTF